MFFCLAVLKAKPGFPKRLKNSGLEWAASLLFRGLVKENIVESLTSRSQTVSSSNSGLLKKLLEDDVDSESKDPSCPSFYRRFLFLINHLPIQELCRIKAVKTCCHIHLTNQYAI